MDMLVVHGGTTLNGRVTVEGAKNAALPIMAAALAVPGCTTLRRVPKLVDVRTMELLLGSLGVRFEHRHDGEVVVDASNVTSQHADYELVRRMRAGICVLGPLLARFGCAHVSLPGGCNIGHRPIDLHLKGMEALGAKIRLENGYVVAKGHQLRGTEISLSGPFGSTVTGTCNVMTAACLAKGRTILRSAACEPEVVDLADFLNSAGAEISGHGTSVIEIKGVENLWATAHRIIPDRIEAATLALAVAATRGNVIIDGVRPEHLQSVLETMSRMDINVRCSADQIQIDADRPLRTCDITALPYPEIPSDAQAQFMALMTTISGTSVVRDRVFPDRFMHVSELARMGADIRLEGSTAIVSGGRPLTGAAVMACDLRASAALVIAALAASGRSEIRRIYHLDRGYSALETRLQQLGANIRRCHDPESPGIDRKPHFHQMQQLQNQPHPF